MRVISLYGHLPFWDARGFGGHPLVGNPQSGMFYPPVWVVWWSGADSALGWLTIGHLLWGSFGVYALMRSAGQGRLAATVAASVYQASPLLLAQVFEGHYPHVWAVCWYPWAFWCYAQARTAVLKSWGLSNVPCEGGASSAPPARAGGTLRSFSCRWSWPSLTWRAIRRNGCS